MKLKAGDYIELEGVSEEGLKQVRDAFVSAGFEEGQSIYGRGEYNFYGVDNTDGHLFFYYDYTNYSTNPRILTIDQVLSTNIEFEEAHQQVVQATPEVSEEEEEAFMAIEKQAVKTDQYNAYFKDIRHLDKLDLYRVVDLFEVNDHALEHAIKKLLLCGVRTGGKDNLEEIIEARDTLNRKIEMIKEDAGKLDFVEEGE